MWKWRDIPNNWLLRESFSLINVKRKGQNEKEADFWCLALSHIVQFLDVLKDVFSGEKKTTIEERKELMNEGGYKNRKPRGERGSRKKKDPARLNVERLDRQWMQMFWIVSQILT